MKSIRLKTNEVQAILRGDKDKTQTRIPIEGMGNAWHYGKLLGEWALSAKPYIENGLLYWDLQTDVDDSRVFTAKLPYQVGDTFWVRETWRDRWGMSYAMLGNGAYEPIDDAREIEYKAGGNGFFLGGLNLCPSEDYKITWGEWSKWRPSIHMPREAARLILKVVDVRVERLQDMTEDDAKAEGIEPIIPGYADGRPSWLWAFRDLWNSIYSRKGQGWDTNLWVWVIEFEVTKNER